MTDVQLPLFDFFLQLRDADFPLGIDEYHVLLRALQLGFGVANTESLRRLCYTLWVKSPEEGLLFDYHFNLMFSASAAMPIDGPSQMPQRDEEATASNRSATSPTSQQGMSPANEPSMALPTAYVRVVSDEVQTAQTVQKGLMGADIPRHRVLLTTEYFPVTRREMKQTWRHLRRMVKEGPAMNLNMEETIKKIGREGVLLEPVLEPSRINQTALLLAVDQEGSMVPFHSLARRLIETAVRGGRLNRASIFYFHNCPTDYFYLDPACVEAQAIDAILANPHREWRVLLVFSDAGAARGGFNLERIEMTQQFLQQVQRGVKRVTWLNPMPRQRWPGTTAGAIAQVVPMFEVTRRGMDNAIDVLRGRYTPLRGRL